MKGLQKYYSNRTGKEICHLVYLFIYIYIYRNVYNPRWFCFAQDICVVLIYLYTRPACSNLGHFNERISNQVPLRTVSIYWIHPSAHYTCLISTGQFKILDLSTDVKARYISSSVCRLRLKHLSTQVLSSFRNP